MSNLQKQAEERHVPLGTILSRASVSLFLFAVVLLGLLVLSQYLLLPRLTAIDVEGSVRSAPDLLSYRESIVERIEEKERQRDQLIVPMEQSLYGALARNKHRGISFLGLKNALGDVAKSIHPEVDDVVAFQRLRYDPRAQKVELVGDVRHVGPRSMTVLAQLLEEIRTLPFVVSVESPHFTRVEDPRIGQHSPFSFTLHLQ